MNRLDLFLLGVSQVEPAKGHAGPARATPPDAGARATHCAHALLPLLAPLFDAGTLIRITLPRRLCL